MSPLQLCCTSMLLLLALSTRSHGQLRQDEVDVLPVRTYSCEDVENLLEASFDLGVEEDGARYIDLDITLDDPITEIWKVSLQVDMWNNGDWDNNLFFEEGTICFMLDKYMSKIWDNLKIKSDPPILHKCTIDEGHYLIKGFTVGPNDYQLPATKLGSYRTRTTVYDEFNTVVWCQYLEVEIDKN